MTGQKGKSGGTRSRAGRPKKHSAPRERVTLNIDTAVIHKLKQHAQGESKSLSELVNQVLFNHADLLFEPGEYQAFLNGHDWEYMKRSEAERPKFSIDEMIRNLESLRDQAMARGPETIENAFHGLSKADVKRKFKMLSKRYHPDHGGTQADFIRLQEAYQLTLSAINSQWA